MSSPPTKRSILLALPTMSNNMKAGTAITLIQLVKTLMDRGHDVHVHNIDSAEIVTARDMFANMLLFSHQWDALLFVDSDMKFDPAVVLKMIDLNADFVAAACPRRSIDLGRFLSAAQGHGNVHKAIAEASSFTVNLSWVEGEQVVPVATDGFISAVAAGMACTFITKKALQAMVEEKAVEPRLDLDAGPGVTCWSFFDNAHYEGERLGEDYSFCYRWTKVMGRKLWVHIDADITHIGHYDFTARYADLL